MFHVLMPNAIKTPGSYTPEGEKKKELWVETRLVATGIYEGINWREILHRAAAQPNNEQLQHQTWGPQKS